MKWTTCLKGFAAAAATYVSGTGQTEAAFTLELDYSYDAGGFFTPTRRTLMDSVAAVFQARIQDSLSAITPGGSDHWAVQFYNPVDGSLATVNDVSISAGTLKVYLGARNLGGGTLGVGGYGGVSSGSGSGSFISAINDRGQAGVAGNTDFAPWGGSIAFSSTATWYFDTDPSTTESFAGSDFYSVALHEVGHLLGIGTALSWNAQINGSHQFTGANSVSEHGGNVPLESDDGHFQEGLTSHILGTATSQEVALDPTLTTITRKVLTDLDWAALQDIGWQVVPEPSEYVLFALGGLALIRAYRRKA